MPRMLPADIYSGCPSPGERDIFLRLRDSPSIDDWVILHSLDLAHHVRQVSGEADFVVLAPGLGLLCLEVKACRHLRRDERGWWYGSNPKPDLRGPFRQAADAMHSIRKRLANAHPQYSGIVCWSAVIFPYLDFNESSEEWHQWQVIDSKKLRSGSLPHLLENILLHARSYLREKGAVWFESNEKLPTITQVKQVTNILRPSFELFVTPKTRAQQVENELKQYTEEQYRALDAMTSNRRVLFRGPAGTGKTLLAIESARRAASQNRHVLLLCFNRYLGHWLAEQMEGMKSHVRVSTVHRYMLDIAGIAPPPTPKSHFWDIELPTKALGALLDETDASIHYDELVVDEAQDVLRSDYLDVLDLSLQGGIASGKWRFLGDFEKQSLYVTAGQDPIATLQKRAPSFADYKLRENCRNPPRIACLAHLLGRLAPDYSRVLRPDNGIEPEILYYSNASHQGKLVSEQLELLFKEGFRAGDIVVLSARADQYCVSATHVHTRWQLCPLAERSDQRVGYCSIHAFKGLEARAVILTDLEDLAPTGTADLFYTGVTRPLERLTILLNRNAKASIVNALLGRANRS